MRILHTADWHIGQKLHERSRHEEHKQFLDWLLKLIKEHKIQLLLVSGDIFDTSLPSAEATNLYYEFLYKLSNESETYTVIIAGNHDSARHLEAPREFLKMGRIHVVGLVNDPSECVFTFPPDNPRVAVAAIPYISENELQHISFETEVEKSDRYQEFLKDLYTQCVAEMPTGIPKILMGHFFVEGGSISGSERRTQGEPLNESQPSIRVGGATAVHAADFPEDVDYVALGHLHRPQTIKGTDFPIRYSGSPIPLRFSEAHYRKKIFILNISDSGVLQQEEEIEIPVFKELCVVEGDELSLQQQAMSGDWEGKYIQVKLTLDTVGKTKSDEIRNAFTNRGGDVLIIEVKMPESDGGPTIQIEDMKHPEEIFEQYHISTFDNPPDVSLKQTFSELLQMVEESK
ncbi:exonuclease subunit SbcD [Candidatus Poribacteria bacterium]|nr:exonuclease subunit SbcD [Candidatus Poribacteria bacterium]